MKGPFSFTATVAIFCIFSAVVANGQEVKHAKAFDSKRRIVTEFLETIDWSRGQDPPDLRFSLEVYNPRHSILTTILFESGSSEGFFGILVSCNQDGDLEHSKLKINKRDYPAFMQLLQEVDLPKLPQNDPFAWRVDSNKCVIKLKESDRECEIARYGLFDLQKFRGTTASQFLKTGELERKDEQFIRSDQENRLVVLCATILAVANRLDLLFEYTPFIGQRE